MSDFVIRDPSHTLRMTEGRVRMTEGRVRMTEGRVRMTAGNEADVGVVAVCFRPVWTSEKVYIFGRKILDTKTRKLYHVLYKIPRFWGIWRAFSSVRKSILFRKNFEKQQIDYNFAKFVITFCIKPRFLVVKPSENVLGIFEKPRLKVKKCPPCGCAAGDRYVSFTSYGSVLHCKREE